MDDNLIEKKIYSKFKHEQIVYEYQNNTRLYLCLLSCAEIFLEYPINFDIFIIILNLFAKLKISLFKLAMYNYILNVWRQCSQIFELSFCVCYK